MKKKFTILNPDKIQVLLFLSVFLSFTFAYSQNTFLPFIEDNIISQDEITLPNRIVDDHEIEYIELEYTFQGAFVSNKIVENETYHYLNIQNFGKMNDIGKPALPAYNDFIAIPENATAKIIIIDKEFIEVTGFMIHPALKPALDTEGAPEPEFEINNILYNTDEFYPENIIEIINTPKLRSTALSLTLIRPVQVNPLTNTLRVYLKIKYC